MACPNRAIDSGVRKCANASGFLGFVKELLEHFGWLGVSLKDAGFAGAMIDTDYGEVWGIMARLCRDLASDVFTLALCRLFACWPVFTVSDFCGCRNCNKF